MRAAEDLYLQGSRLVELAERHRFIVATAMGFSERVGTAPGDRATTSITARKVPAQRILVI
jgi:hypothetical protein